MKRPFLLGSLWLLVLAVAGCPPGKATRSGAGVTAAEHVWFPITPGTPHALNGPIAEGVMACESCHPPQADSFTEFDCLACHGHAPSVTNRLHTSVPGYGYTSALCLACHPDGSKVPYDHAGITDNCAECHDVGAQFAALPRAGFTHPETGGADCGNCHTTPGWKNASAQGTFARDPNADLAVTALLPSWAGPTIIAVNPFAQLLPMPMNHASTQVPAAASSACANCHLDAPASYYPGTLHSALANLSLGPPSGCNSCHTASRPVGFVGPTATSPARTPASGEMRHDAVAWASGAPTLTSVVPGDCAVCHLSPTELTVATWRVGQADGGAARFHAALTASSLPQPASCIDCHANARPTGTLSAPGAALPSNLAYDHTVATALDDCGSCHAASAPGFATWAGGRFHPAGAPNPSTCLPCHAAERPTSTAGWQSATYTQSPFDYVTNARGITHGAGQDCARCHPGPGTGAWGGSQNWQGGNFMHGPGTPSATGCVSCHLTQRPDLLPGQTAPGMAALLGFDHSLNGTGDCFGCHQATVAANTYRNLYDPGTGTLPNGDWKGGQSYPGATFVASTNAFLNVTELRLNRSGANNLVTSTSQVTTTLFNGMQHTSAALPAALNAGPSGAPDNGKCWHCHTHDAGVVTAYADGQYHSALTGYRATPDGGLAAFPQPTGRCDDCHAQMRPSNIVEKAGSNLVPMDHAATFTAAVNIGGVNATGAAALDCSVCHASPGATWADGVFHARIATAVPADCTVCHYPLMADPARADLTSGTRYAMRHRAPVITFQRCDTCHAQALGKSTQTPAVATLFQTGAYHGAVAAQPGACNDCHALSDPAVSTASSWQYTLAQGSTATNQRQWMSHTAPSVSGKDCAVCHAADARQTGSAWDKATQFHQKVTTVPTCRECHGLTNGGGATPGANNNLPSGLTNSSTQSPVSAVPSSGVPAGTYDQLTHADLNASARDCNFCHTQVGLSSVAGLAGKEWKQARFHTRFSAASPLVMNTTTARCSNCHLNLKPGAAYTAQNHSSYTAAPGSTDCAACHSWPGTGSASAPNWKGAVGGAPVYLTVGGFTVTQPPAANGSTVVGGINNLPHPAGSNCAQCHPGGVGGKRAIGYDHASTLIGSNCRSCHESGSDLVGTPWNNATTQSGGLGSTRPYSIVSLLCSFETQTRPFTNHYQHFYPVDCKECHPAPTGTVNASTGTTYRTRWKFRHDRPKMTNPGTCNLCHASPNNYPK